MCVRVRMCLWVRVFGCERKCMSAYMVGLCMPVCADIYTRTHASLSTGLPQAYAHAYGFCNNQMNLSSIVLYLLWLPVLRILSTHPSVAEPQPSNHVLEGVGGDPELLLCRL